MVNAWTDYSSRALASRRGIVRGRMLFEILRRGGKRLAWERWMQVVHKGRGKEAAMSRIRVMIAMDKMVSEYIRVVCMYFSFLLSTAL